MSPAIGNIETDHEPMDRLTRMCKAMTDAFDDHDEHREGDKCIVFLDDGEMGGIGIHGYDSVMDAFVNLLMHVKAMLEAVNDGLHLQIVDDDGKVMFQ